MQQCGKNGQNFANLAPALPQKMPMSNFKTHSYESSLTCVDAEDIGQRKQTWLSSCSRRISRAIHGMDTHYLRQRSHDGVPTELRRSLCAVPIANCHQTSVKHLYHNADEMTTASSCISGGHVLSSVGLPSEWRTSLNISNYLTCLDLVYLRVD